MRKTRSLLAPLASIVLALTAAGCDPGGCPWTKLSDLAVSPSADCLDVAFVSDNGDGSTSGGCVDPVLTVTNNCSDSLAIDHEYIIGGGDELIGPGVTTQIEIGDTAVTGHAHGDDYVVPAMLANQAIEIAFEATGGDAGD